MTAEMNEANALLARDCRKSLPEVAAEAKDPGYGEQLRLRLSDELRIIRAWGLSPFLLFVRDLFECLRGREVPFSFGLRYESCSLTAHLLGLAPLEPLHHRFFFERLLYERDKSLLGFWITLPAERRKDLAAFVGTRFSGLAKERRKHALRDAMERVLPYSITCSDPADLEMQTMLSWLRKHTGVQSRDIPRPAALHAFLSASREGKLEEFPYLGPFDDAGTIRASRIGGVEDLECLWAAGQGPGGATRLETLLQERRVSRGLLTRIPILREILANSRNALLFQEQLMWIAHEIAGFSRMDANRLRRALGARIKIDPFREKFLSGGAANGHARRDFDVMFAVLDRNAAALYPRSYTSAHVDLVLQLAHFGDRYPAAFREARSKVRSVIGRLLVLDLNAFIPLYREQ